MTANCVGICERYKAPSAHYALRYSTGQKRCNHCDCFFITTNLRCICCKTQLRTKTHNGKRHKNIIP